MRGFLTADPGTTLFLIWINGLDDCALSGAFIPDADESKAVFASLEEAKQAAEDYIERWFKSMATANMLSGHEPKAKPLVFSVKFRCWNKEDQTQCNGFEIFRGEPPTDADLHRILHQMRTNYIRVRFSIAISD